MATLLGPIGFYRGDSYPLELTIKNKTTKIAIDITGYSFKLTVDTLEDPPDNTTKLFDITGILDGVPTTGKVSFKPTTVNTDQEKGEYYYDIEMIDASSNKRTIKKETFTILQDISK